MPNTPPTYVNTEKLKDVLAKLLTGIQGESADNTLTQTQVDAVAANLAAQIAVAATDTELSTGLATKQDASTAATDAELAAATSQEAIQDLAAPLLAHAFHTNITATYDDAANRILLSGGAGGTATDASATAKGIVQLANDLAGTAAAPTVPGLAGKANTTHPHSGADITSGTVDIARIGTGTKDATTVLRGDGFFAVSPLSTTSLRAIRWNNARWERVGDPTSGVTAPDVDNIRVGEGPIMWIAVGGPTPGLSDGWKTGDLVVSEQAPAPQVVRQILPMTRPGALAVGNGQGITTTFGFVVTDRIATLNVGGTTSNVVLHLWKNGVNVHTITLTPGQTANTLSGLSIAYAAGDSYALRIEAVDSGATANGLTVTLGVVYS